MRRRRRDSTLFDGEDMTIQETPSDRESSAPPLRGLRVLEMGQLLAAPFASALLAWFGAEVIKIEPPGGDPIRTWRTMRGDTSLWWYGLNRNKKSVTLNLKHEKAPALVKRLVERMDVVVENFKPGALEKWGLGYDDLKAVNPKIIMARVSGWGQTGPNRGKPGFAAVAEGVGGLRYVTGYPDRPPARANLSLGDTLAGLHAALGVLTALYHRDAKATGEGQVVDVALYEAVFNVMESAVPEYDLAGVIRERQGTTVSGIAPTNVYPCQDGKYVIIGGNGDGIFKRLMAAIGRPDMATDARFARNDDRVRHAEEIDAAISAWTRERTDREAIAALEAADVPVGPIYSVADQMSDAHFRDRGLFELVTLPDGATVTLPAMSPKLTATPGATRWVGPALGEHNAQIYRETLGLSDAEVESLRAEGVI
jgi:crotonobetainyl-CoA:carnitine CoA-transferase CaiB-like acyl-CoA transferase